MNILTRLSIEMLQKKRRKFDDLLSGMDEDTLEAVQFLYSSLWDEFHRNDAVFTQDMHKIREELMEWLPAPTIRYMYKQMKLHLQDLGY